MVEGARLESVYTLRYRGFEPLPLRQLTSVQRPVRSQFAAQPRTRRGPLKRSASQFVSLGPNSTPVR